MYEFVLLVSSKYTDFVTKKTHPLLLKDGKNCYEKEFTSKLVKSKYK